MAKPTPHEILSDPFLNKGTAFSQKERDEYGLNGYLPYHVSTLEEQVTRRYENFSHQKDELSKYLFLTGLQDRNEILFYKLVSEHITEMLPLIYTPTVGDVSLLYSSLYRHHRGAYIPYPLKDKMEEMINHLASPDLDVVVVTDGERILGLGDVGVGGMAIPLGKLSLYTLFGGIHPKRVLPVLLDVGTENETLLNDPLYLGWRHRRIRGGEYDAFVDSFIQALKKRCPKVLLQWEDFGKEHARPLLERYRHQICSFNDDIQGTAAVVLAGILSGLKKMKSPLKEQKIVIFGAGSAGMGISALLVKAMVADGMSEKEARSRFYILDRHGLIHEGMEGLDPEHRKYARPRSEAAHCLYEVILHAKPTILIGVSAQPGAFTEQAITQMAKTCPEPIIFPLSNPTSHSEAHPADLHRWTHGKGIIATGSPFPDTPQCNNVYIFPGVGLGIVAGGIETVTDSHFIQAAHILSDACNQRGVLFPRFEDLRAISRQIALSLCGDAKKVDSIMWTPTYEKAAARARS